MLAMICGHYYKHALRVVKVQKGSRVLCIESWSSKISLLGKTIQLKNGGDCPFYNWKTITTQERKRQKTKEMLVFCFNTNVQCTFTIPYPWPYGNGGHGGGLINNHCPIVMGSRIRLASLHEGTQLDPLCEWHES